jgi:FKBP-type peptidyl-prolyl cis-trans isomerase FklB
MDTLSYGVGIILAQNLKKQGFTELDSSAVALGIKDVLEGNPMRVSAEEANQVIQQHLTELKKGQASEALKEGSDFLAKNAQRSEVQVTDSGLQYEVIQEGSGQKPGPNAKVTTHYKGTLIDGTVFDSSYKRGQPAEFPLNQVIRGWQEVIQLMPVGSKWRTYIPHDLAYGESGAGDAIPPFSTLIFDIELLEIA